MDKIVYGRTQHPDSAGKMHKKCFNAFEKAIKIKSELVAKVKGGLNAIVPPECYSSPSGSYVRESSETDGPSCSYLPPPKRARPSFTHQSASPDVMVNLTS